MEGNLRRWLGRMAKGVVGRKGLRARRRAAAGRAELEPLEGRALLSAGFGPGRHPHTVPGMVGAPATVTGVREIHNVPYTTDGGHTITLDLYLPAGRPPAGGWPAVIGFPGGGFKWANKVEYGSHISALVSDGFVVAAADYTYSSGAPGSRAWPMNLQDAQNAVRWVRSHAARLGVNPNQIAATGVSAGAYLANMLGTYPAGPVSAESLPADASGRGTALGGVSARVQAVVDFYGPVDLTQLFQQVPHARPDLITFLGGTPDQVGNRYVAASPSQFVSPDDPPFLILQGTADQTVLPAQSEELSSELSAAGVPNKLVLLPGFTHGFELHIGPLDLTPQIATFLDQALNHQPITS
jgi:acetyl esterase/lipase